MKTKLAISALVVAGTIGISEAQLVDGQTIGIDFGNNNPTTNDFIEYGTPGAGVVAVTKDVTGAPVAGTVTISTSGFTGENGDAIEKGGEDPVFDTSNLEDWMGFPASASITISGLDNSLEYELTIGAGFSNLNGQTIYSADGQSVTPDPLAANPFGTLSNLETDGAGKLVISLNKNVLVVTVSALTLTASTPPTGNTWQLDGSGNWSTPANWSPAVPNAADANATFDEALPLNGPLTATLDVPVTVGDLALNSSQAITIAGASLLTFDSTGTADLSATAGAHAITAGVVLSDPLGVALATGCSIDVSGALSGASTVTLVGSGDLTLSGDLSGFTGGLIAEGGVLEVASGSTATDVARMNTKTGGEINISGTVTLASNASFGVGAGVQGTTGTVTVESGGELNIGAGGAFTGIGGGDLAGETGQSGNGTLTITGGTVNVDAPGTNNSGAGGLDARNLWFHPYGDGGGTSSINLDAGLLSMARPMQRGSSGTSIFNFNGGTLQVAASTAGAIFVNMTRVNVRDGGGTIDTQGFDITCNQAFLHSNIGGDAATDGGLTKLGSATLTLGGANTYTGPTNVSEGTLGLTGSLAGDVSVADGATLSGAGSTTGDLTLGGTTGANLVLDPASSTGITAVDLTLNGVTTVSFSTPPATGQIVAIATSSGTITDGNGGDLSDSFTVPGYSVTAVTNNAGTLEFVVLPSILWTGTTSGDWQIEGPDANWDSVDGFFSVGDEVGFTDTGSNKSITIAADVDPSVTVVANSAGNDYSFSGSAITGSTGLLKEGTGGLTLLNANTYSGTTTISGGTLQLGDGGTTGSLAAGTVITNDGNLTINRSDAVTQSTSISSSGISGTGSVTKTGTGNLTIDRANTYAGGTTISDGVLIFSGTGSTSTTGAILVENGGTIRFNRNDTWGNAATAATPVITIDTGGVVESNNKYTGLIDLVLNGGTLSANDGVNANFPTFGLKGTVTVNATTGGSFISTTGAGDFNTVGIGSTTGGSSTTFGVADGTAASDLTVSVPLSNNGGGTKGLIKTGAGTITLDAVNTFIGNTSVEEGVLTLADGGRLRFVPGADTVTNKVAGGGAGSGTLNLDGEIFLDLGGAATSPGSSWLLVDDSVLAVSYGGTFSVNSTLGAFTDSAGTWTLDDGIIAWTFTQATGTLAVGASSTPYGQWVASFGLTGADALPTANPDGDSLVNLLEFAFGSDPSASTGEVLVSGGTVTQAGVPTIWTDPADGRVYLRYSRRADYASVVLGYTEEFSPDDLVFDAGDDVADNLLPVIGTGTGAGGVAVEAVQLEFPWTMTNGGRKARFGRIDLTYTP